MNGLDLVDVDGFGVCILRFRHGWMGIVWFDVGVRCVRWNWDGRWLVIVVRVVNLRISLFRDLRLILVLIGVVIGGIGLFVLG